jgi:hypothetical protein
MILSVIGLLRVASAAEQLLAVLQKRSCIYDIMQPRKATSRIIEHTFAEVIGNCIKSITNP